MFNQKELSIVDLHIHSKYSRGCSTKLDIKSLEKWGKIKGIDILGTGDFTHPKWYKELKENLTERDGMLYTEKGFKFIPQTEISFIYTDEGKGRKVHNVILAPNLEIAGQIKDYFESKGRIDYDGRPIFKIPCDQLVEDMRKISRDIEIISAHAWTPHFGLLGSKSGYNSVEEAFKDQTKYIHALETGISSTPQMNYKISKLDKFSMVSFSDAHSFWPWRLGREATILKDVKTCKDIISSIRNHNIHSTIEVDPAYGKYHWDGHAKCNCSMSPKDTNKNNMICPVCNKPMTLGVDYRVDELSDRDENYKADNKPPFITLLPLSELISLSIGKGLATKSVWSIYWQFIKKFGNEFNILMNAKKEDMDVINPHISKLVVDNRKGNIKVQPGYDGVYGKPLL